MNYFIYTYIIVKLNKSKVIHFSMTTESMTLHQTENIIWIDWYYNFKSKYYPQNYWLG